jgi:hypothetical protein
MSRVAPRKRFDSDVAILRAGLRDCILCEPLTSRTYQQFLPLPHGIVMLEIDMQYFLISPSFLQRKIDVDFPLVVDVSVSKKAPELVVDDDDARMVRLRSQINSLFDYLRRSHPNGQQCLHVPWNSEEPLVALMGWMLGYRVVYYVDGPGHCLQGVSLRRYVKMHGINGSEIELIAFTVPQNIVDAHAVHVDTAVGEGYVVTQVSPHSVVL